MKLAIIIALAFSFSAFASESTQVSSFGISSTFDLTTNGLNICKEAAVVINDANEFYATGTVSPALSAHIKAVQSDSDVSEQEAVDMLVGAAQDALIANQKN